MHNQQIDIIKCYECKLIQWGSFLYQSGEAQSTEISMQVTIPWNDCMMGAIVFSRMFCWSSHGSGLHTNHMRLLNCNKRIIGQQRWRPATLGITNHARTKPATTTNNHDDGVNTGANTKSIRERNRGGARSNHSPLNKDVLPCLKPMCPNT